MNSLKNSYSCDLLKSVQEIANQLQTLKYHDQSKIILNHLLTYICNYWDMINDNNNRNALLKGAHKQTKAHTQKTFTTPTLIPTSCPWTECDLH